ncbi:MAG: TolC family protein, partial [Deltaproteobacteria bacterium]
MGLKPCRALYFKLCLTATMAGLGFILLCRGWALGEEQKRGKLVLGLEELIQMAIVHSPEVAENRSDLAIAESQLAQAKAGYYPQIESTALIGPVNDAEEPVIRDNRIYDPSPEGLSSLGVFGRVDLTVTQPLYTFGKLSRRKEAARSGVNARKFTVTSKENEIALRVTELYYALILAEGGVKSADEAREFFDEAKKRISRLLELNALNVAESDLYRVDAFRADTQRSRARAQKGVRFASFALKALIGLAPEAEFEVVEKD